MKEIKFFSFFSAFFLPFLSFSSLAVDVQISQLTDTPDPATRGGNVTYAISLLNANNDTATNVQLAIPLPATTSFVSVDDGSCTHDGGSPGTVNCSFGNITGDGFGAPVTNVSMVLKTSAGSGATIALTATVSTASVDSDGTNDSETQNTTIDDGADLNIVQSDSADPIVAGSSYSYSLNVNNIGPNTANTVTLTNTLPVNVSYVAASGGGWTCGNIGQVVTCTRSSIASAAAAPVITIDAKATSAIIGTVTNIATVSALTGDPESSNNTSSENTVINTGTDLTISKAVAEPVIGLATTSFTLSPRNLGPFDASTVSVTDILPAGFTYINAIGTGWACNEVAGTVTCTRASYVVGATDDITIQTNVPASGSNIINSGSISSTTPEADVTNDTDSVTFSVVPDGADLSITKTKSPNPVAQGANMTSSIVVSNLGPNSTSAIVTVTDTLSINETFSSFSGANWACIHAGASPGGVVTCEYKVGVTPIAVANNANAPTLNIVTVATNAGTSTNTACVVDVGGQTDGVAGNNCATASAVTTTNIADLSIAKSVTTGGVTNNVLEDNETQITYVLNVTNTGNDIVDAIGGGIENGVVITDTIPGFVSGDTVINATITGGSQQNFTCTVINASVSCILNDGETFGGTVDSGADTVEVTITTDRGLFDGVFTNTANVSSSILGENNTGDNSDSVGITIDPVTDVEMQSLAITPGTTEAGTDVTYVLTFINNGPSSASTVVVTNVFSPVGRTYQLESSISSQGSCVALVGNTLTCNIGTLIRNQTETVTLVVGPSWDGANTGWVLGNNSTISTTTTESNAGNNSQSENLTVTQAQLDLLVNNIDELDPVGWTPTPIVFPTSLNNIVVYKIDMTNRGPSSATGVTLTDVMTPKTGKQVEFLCDGTGNTNCTVGTSVCNNLGTTATGPASITTSCSIPDIESGNSYTRYLYFEAVDQPDSTGDTHNNVATISSNEDDTVASNDNESETTSIRVMVDIGVTVDPSQPSVAVNEPFNWNIVVNNNGPGDSAQSSLTDTLPAGMELTGPPVPGQGTCTGVAGGTSFSCALGTINNGANTTITVPVRITVYPVGGTSSNPASVTTFGVDTDGSNDNDTGTVTVTKSSIAGTVFNDQDDDGLIDGSEHGISGVTVTLSGNDSWGNAINKVQVTDVNGEYLFDNLPPSNSYTLTETHPANYNDGLDNAAGTLVTNSRTSEIITSISLAQNTALTDFNFGNLGMASLLGSVWHDVNNDGNKDAGEIRGIANTTITLTGTETVSTKAVNITTTTNSTGNYQFSNLTSGTYIITETQPISWGDGSEQLGSAGGVVGADQFTGIVLTPAQSGNSYNFGEQGGTLAGKVYRDTNSNGLIDGGEVGIANVSVKLNGKDADTNTISLTTTTDNTGSYTFTALPASDGAGYTITETQPDLIFDGKDALGTAGGVLGNDKFTSVVIAANSVHSGYNFGEGGDITSSITGFVFIDNNANGLKEVGELPLENITITLTGKNRLGFTYNESVLTNSSGQYTFSNIIASDTNGYTLTQTHPTQYNDGLESILGTVITSSDTSDTINNIQLKDDERLTGYNFAELYSGNLSGTVYTDDNNNGLFDVSESGIEGVSLQLTGVDIFGTTISLNTITSVDGSYAFTQLIPSNVNGYKIIELHPEGYVDGFESIGQTIVLESDKTDEHSGIAVELASNLTGYNFGERLRSSIIGTVFNDLNDDGVQSEGEKGIEGVEFILTGVDHLGAAVSITVVSDENGQYMFSDLLESNNQGYQITETQPEAFLDGLDTENNILIQGSHYTDLYTLVVAPGTDYENYNFGELTPSTIAGTVWVDTNNNGQIDELETFRIANVSISLKGIESFNNTANSPNNAENASVTQIVKTDENGYYQFTQLRSGEYSVTQQQPSAWLDGKDQIGSLGGVLANDVITEISIEITEQATNYNFGEKGSQLSGIVFNDLNDNGVQEKAESGIPLAVLQLTGTDKDNQPISRSVQTQVDGLYTFFDIPLSNATGFTLTEIQPEDVSDGQDSVGSIGGTLIGSTLADGTLGNDVIENIIFDEHITFATGYNFGELLTNPAQISGMVWLDSNHNRDEDDGTGLSGWVVQLIDTRVNPLDNNNIRPIATVTTDSNGEYLFDGLSAGIYEVRFIHPEGDVIYGYPVSSESGVDLSNGTIRNLMLDTGEHIEQQNLPIDPSGVVYNSKTREPVAGARVTIEGPAGFDPNRDLVGGANNVVQITSDNGIYQYLLFTTAPSGVYTLSVVEPTGYVEGVSPSIPACINTPVITAMPNPVLVHKQDLPPPLNAEIHDAQSCPTTSADFANSNESTQYYLSFIIDPQLPSGNIINNHIPVDPYTDDMFSVIKTSNTKNASRGDIVPYTISVVNNLNYELHNVNVIDQLPPGFKYIQGSAKFDGASVVLIQKGRQIVLNDLNFTGNQQSIIELMTRIGSGVSEGEYINQAWAELETLDVVLSNIGDATVRIVPDPIFDCSDIVGKVFNDENANGYQDKNEKGLPAVRLATARGLLVTTDSTGKYHIACAAVPNERRGANFVLKVDERTLPSGFRITTENPRVVRLTRGKLVKANFGATIHRVVRIQLTDLAFTQNNLKEGYLGELAQAINALKEKPSIIRLAYAQADETSEMVDKRLSYIKNVIEQEWQQCDCNYELMIEEEVYKSKQLPDVLRKVRSATHE